MTNKLVVALACLGLAASAGAEVNFDKGVDTKGVITQASATKDYHPEPGRPGRVRYSRDCRNFSFGPSAYPQSSQRYMLDSTEYIEECHFVPAPPPPPPTPPAPKPPVTPPNNGGNNGGNHGGNHGGNPGNHNGPKDLAEMKDGPQNHSYSGNHGGKPGQWVCRERIGQTFRTTAQVNLAARQLYPWENESFSVCMEGPRVDFRTGASPYSYGVDQVGLYDVTFNLTPNYRVPTPPDSDGMSYTAFTYKDGKFILNVSDRWATEYAGEQVAIKVELIKDGFLFFNSSKGEKTFTLNVAGNYELAFAESDLTKNKDFVDDSGDLKGAKKFFVKWGFRRIGRISTQDYIGKGDTSKIPQ